MRPVPLARRVGHALRRAWHAEVLRRVRRYLHQGVRLGWYGGAVVVVLLAVFFTVARVLLPDLAQRKAELEARFEGLSGHPVSIARLGTYWEGLSPGLHLEQVAILAPDRRAVAVRLKEVRVSLALLPLLWGEVRINTLKLTRPSLALERLADGRFRVTGIDMPDSGEAGGGEAFLEWLFRQHRVVVEDAELRWLDHRERDRPLSLKRVHATLRNDGSRHRLSFDALFPPEICQRCSVALDLRGNPLADSDWHGDIYARIEAVDVTRLPRVLRERLPATLRGAFSAELWSTWRDARVHALHGRLQVTGLALPLRAGMLRVAQASGNLDWQRHAAGWRMTLREAALGVQAPARALGDLRIEQQPAQLRVDAKEVHLEDLTALVQMLAERPAGDAAPAATGADAAASVLSALAPRGTVQDLALRLDGEPAQPDDFRVSGRVRALTTRAHGRLPGLHAVNARFAVTPAGGNVELEPSALTVDLPWLFAAPLEASRASGRFTWERDAERWLIRGEKLRIAGADLRASGQLQLRIPRTPDGEPHLRLRFDFDSGNGAHAARYYPIRYLPQRTRRFLEEAIVAGEVTDGHVIYEGVGSRFPFRDGDGRFEVVAKVRNAVYRYLPGWEPVRAADVDVVVRGGDVRITGRGRIGRLDLRHAEVRLELPGGAREGVSVRASVAGPLADTLAVLRAVKPAAGGVQPPWKRYLPDGLTGAGDGELTLALEIPFDERPLKLDGEYRLARGALLLDAPALTVEGLEGNVQFDAHGVRAGTVRGRLFGGTTLVALASGADGAREAQASGRLFAAELKPLLGARIASQLAGSAVWHLRWRERDGRIELDGEMPLSELRATLPAPLDRPRALASAPLRVRTEHSTPNALVLAASIGEQASGRFALARDAHGWHLERGRLAFGEARAVLPRTRELQVSVLADTVDLDGWLERLGGRDGAQAAPALLTRIAVDSNELIAFNRQLGRMAFEFERGADGWSGVASGPAAAGRIRLVGAPLRSVELDLAHLHVPAERSDTPAPSGADSTDPRRLPSIVARVQALRVKERALGQFEVRGAPAADGWRAQHLQLVREELRITGHGEWRVAAGAHSSRVELTLDSADAGKSLAAFGMPDQLAGGQAHVSASLSWPGMPADFEAARMSGRLELSAEKGQFLQAKPGAARLFGLVDFSSLGRYLQLDFSPIFGKGFVYDEIRGTITLESGNAYTRDLHVKGPAAALSFEGRIGLAAEDYDMVLGVAPRIGTGVTLGAYAVFGPQIALAAFALQQLFKEQISAGTRILYVVKGPWREPSVTRVAAPGANEAGAAP